MNLSLLNLHGTRFSARAIALAVLSVIFIVVLLKPGRATAQRPQPVLAQVGLGAPLPVYVVNDMPPMLPEGFVPGSIWKFTTWTIPSTLTFNATVQKVEGGWALLSVNGNTPTGPRWYYVPQMPGVWEVQ